MEDNLTQGIIIGIITSFIASILFYLILPLFKKIGIGITKKIENVSTQFRNSIYLKASEREYSHWDDLGIILTLNTMILIILSVSLFEKLDTTTNIVSERMEHIIAWVLGITIATIILFRWSIRERIKSIVKYFEFIFTSARPYLTELESHEINKKWILIKNKEMHDNLIKEIKNVIEKNKKSSEQSAQRS